MLIISVTIIVIFSMIFALLLGVGHRDQDNLDDARSRAKLRVDLLRAERLQRDLEVVEQRAHKLSNDVVLGDLKIEKLRRELRIDDLDWTPTNYQPSDTFREPSVSYRNPDVRQNALEVGALLRTQSLQKGINLQVQEVARR